MTVIKGNLCCAIILKKLHSGQDQTDFTNSFWLDKKLIVESRCMNSIKNGFPIPNGFHSLPFIKIR